MLTTSHTKTFSPRKKTFSPRKKLDRESENSQKFQKFRSGSTTGKNRGKNRDF
jgi:hypothetical protein